MYVCYAYEVREQRIRRRRRRTMPPLAQTATHRNSSTSSSNTTKAAAWAWHLHSTGGPISTASTLLPSIPDYTPAPHIPLDPRAHPPSSNIPHHDPHNPVPAHIDSLVLPTITKRAENPGVGFAAPTPTITTATTRNGPSSMREFSRFRREAQRQLHEKKKASRGPYAGNTKKVGSKISTSTSSCISSTSDDGDGDDDDDDVVDISDHDEYGVWDCGSSLYDAFEIVSFSNRIERNINYWLHILDDNHKTSSTIGTQYYGEKHTMHKSNDSKNDIVFDISTSHHRNQSASISQNARTRSTRWPLWLAKLSTRIGRFYTKSTGHMKPTKHHRHQGVYYTTLESETPKLQSNGSNIRSSGGELATSIRSSRSGNRKISNSVADELNLDHYQQFDNAGARMGRLPQSS